MKYIPLILLFACSISCKSEYLPVGCNDYNIYGGWQLLKLKEIKNKTTSVTTEIRDSTTIVFVQDNTGYYPQNESNEFIWGVQCQFDLLLISDKFNSQDSQSLELYSTRVFQILEHDIGLIELWDTETATNNNEQIETNTYWTLKR